MIGMNSLKRVTPEMLSLVAEIDEFKGAWRALGKLAPERLRQLRKIATIESVGTIKKRLTELVEAGHLVPAGRGRATRYSLS